MIKIAGIEFDNYLYDEDGDVLYLSVGAPRRAVDTDATPEGHAVDFDEHGNIIGMVIVSLRHFLNRDGELRITIPEAHIPADEFIAVLPTAA